VKDNRSDRRKFPRTSPRPQVLGGNVALAAGTRVAEPAELPVQETIHQEAVRPAGFGLDFTFWLIVVEE
jgi:hypothetical protein